MLRRFRPLKPYLARYKKRYGAGFAALLLTQAVGITVPLIIKAGIDKIARGAAGRELFVCAGLLVGAGLRSEEHTSELQSRLHLVCRLLLEKKKKKSKRLIYVNLYQVTRY